MRKYLFMAALCYCVAVYAVPFGNIDITAQPLMGGGNLSRYRTVFRISNKGMQQADVTIRLSDLSAAHKRASRTRSCSVPAGGVMDLTLRAPESERNEYLYVNPDLDRCGLWINGKAPKKFQTLFNSLNGGKRPTFPSSYSFNLDYSGICSGAVPAEQYIILYAKELNSFYFTSAIPGLITSPLDVRQWSGNVIDYMDTERIWLDSEDAVPVHVRSALRKWVFGGGNLVICLKPGTRVPDEYANFYDEGKCIGIKRHGLGNLTVLRLAGTSKQSEVERYMTAFKKEESTGNVMDMLKRGMPRRPAGLIDIDILSSHVMDSGTVRIQSYGSSYNIIPPRVPLLTLLIVMTVMVILVGPVSYLWLKRRHREPLLLVTTPLLSLLFCLLIVLSVSISDGWSMRGRAIGFTYLEQGEHLAATYARVSLLAQSIPSDNFQFTSEDVVELPGTDNIEVLEAPGMCLNPRMMLPRNPFNYGVRRIENRGERLRIVHGADKALEVVNGLGCDLRGVLYRDSDGMLHLGGALPSGTRAALRPLTLDVKPAYYLSLKRVVETAVRDDLSEKLACELKNFAGDLVPGSFIAIADIPVFYSMGIKPDILECVHYVCGPVKEE